MVILVQLPVYHFGLRQSWRRLWLLTCTAHIVS